MRRIALALGVGALWLLFSAATVLADNGPHVQGAYNASLSGSCAGCHRAHSGQAPNLLKEPVEDLCYACHAGNGATTDVKDGQTTTSAALRGGGFEYALIDTSNSQNASWTAGSGDSNKTISSLTSPQTTNSHHSISGDPMKMWGSGPIGTSAASGQGTYTVTTNLECTSCHDPHGNGQYRILKSLPNDAPSGATPVYINDVPLAGTFNYATANYGTGGSAGTSESPLNVAANSGANFKAAKGSVADNSAVQYVPSSIAGNATGYYKGTYIQSASLWCATCHTRYFGDTGAAGNKTWTKDGSGDATFAFLHATLNVVDPNTLGAGGTVISGKVLDPLGAADGSQMFSQIKSPGYKETDRVSGLQTGWYVTGNPYLDSTTGLALVVESYDAALNQTGVTPSSTADKPVEALGSSRQQGDLLAGHAPTCLTCHVSHGSNATDGLGQSYTVGSYTRTLPDETSLVTGTALHSPLLRLDGRAVCQNCHKK